jgi:outer membrane receptor protein involved in Fe transport
VAPRESIARSAAELQEIIVATQRRAEDIQKVPLSVQAIDQQLLTQTGVRDLEDISLFAPGVDFVGYQPGNTVIIIRGISSIGGSLTTALYMDDVPITGQWLTLVDYPMCFKYLHRLFDWQSVDRMSVSCHGRRLKH